MHSLERYAPLPHLLALSGIVFVAQHMTEPERLIVQDPVPVIRRTDEPPAPLDGDRLAKLAALPKPVPEPSVEEPAVPEPSLEPIVPEVRFVPAFRDGVAIGFKVFSIRPDSIYATVGLKNGDVIRLINGNDLSSPENALEIYAKLKSAARLDIVVDRAGDTIHLLRRAAATRPVR
jgi:general secretion pathway protein C